jgi:hypothetical protein
VRVTGLDLSLTGTGVAIVDLNLGAGHPGEPINTAWTINPGKRKGYERLRWIRHGVLSACDGADIIVLEGPSYGSTGSSFHQIAGLWWILAEAIDAVSELGGLAIAPPSSVKKYATGKGNANKDAMMLATARKFPEFDGDNNAADALWMACMGMEHLGCPVVKGHSEALEGVQW